MEFDSSAHRNNKWLQIIYSKLRKGVYGIIYEQIILRNSLLQPLPLSEEGSARFDPLQDFAGHVSDLNEVERLSNHHLSYHRLRCSAQSWQMTFYQRELHVLTIEDAFLAISTISV